MRPMFDGDGGGGGGGWDLRQQRRNPLGNNIPVVLDGSGSGAAYVPPKNTSVPSLPVHTMSAPPIQNPIDPMNMGMGGVMAASNPGEMDMGMGAGGPITPNMVNRVRRQGW